MRQLLILFIGACVCAAPLSAQDIESKLSGSTLSQGFTIKDGNGTSLFTLRGNGRIGMGTSNPLAFLQMDDVSGSTNGLRVNCNTVFGWSGILAGQVGLGNTARFIIFNNASTSNCLETSTNGIGASISANSDNVNGKILELTNGAQTRFSVTSGGTVLVPGSIGMGVTTPDGKLHISGSAQNGVRIEPWQSTGSAIFISQAGSGNAARFDITNSGSTNNCLEATTNALAPAILASSTNASGRILQANNGTSSRFFIESGGNVGIGVDDATQDLDVLNNARFRGVGSSAYSAPLNLTSTGILTTATSDARMKTNIRPLDASLEKVLHLQGVRFNWKSEPDGGDRIGFIAQEVREIVPEVVYTNPVDGYLGLNYAELTALLVEAVKEQQVLIDALRSRSEEVAALQTRVRQLESREDRIRQLEADLVSLRTLIENGMPGSGAAHVSLRLEK